MATTTTTLTCTLVCFTLLFSCISEAYILPLEESQLSRDGSVLQHREKRYTDYQERASAFCTGICMYEQRETYSTCFDLCNWYAFRMKPSSARARQIAMNRARKPPHPPPQPTTPKPAPSRQSSLQNNMQQLLRMGGLPAQRQKQRSRQKSKDRSGRRKSKSQRKMRVKAKPASQSLKMERTKNKSSSEKEGCSCSTENRHTPIF